MDDRFRCFFAVDLAEDVRSGIVTARRLLESRGGDVRWSRPESLHVTLKFLGETPPGKVDGLAGLMAEAARGIPPFLVRDEEGGGAAA